MNKKNLVSLAASALGKKSAEKRHRMLKEKGVDISEYYSNLRRKPNKIKVLTNAE